jgi:hypothetical protein
MADVTITLTDTPSGGVSIHTDFKPAIGAPCTPAQSAALDMMRRTQREWGMQPSLQPARACTPSPAHQGAAI